MQPSLSAGRCVRESHALIVSDWLILNLAVGPDEGMQTKAIPKLVCSIIMIWVSIDKTETVAICSFLLKSSLIEMKSGILADTNTYRAFYLSTHPSEKLVFAVSEIPTLLSHLVNLLRCQRGSLDGGVA